MILLKIEMIVKLNTSLNYHFIRASWQFFFKLKRRIFL